MNDARIVVLGPQRHAPNLREALDEVAPRGTVGLVTAGWEEREEEVEELTEHCGRPTVHLQLFQRAEDVFRRDGELFDAMRDRHDRLRRLQELYRLRLGHAMDACRELLARRRDDELLRGEQEDAIAAVRALDAQHLARIHGIHVEFAERWRPLERPAVERHRRELAGLLDATSGVCIAGGHVAILLNRLRLFQLCELTGERPLVCWSAGAMALARRVVVFHDSPPQGMGNAEVLEEGLGVLGELLPLPHANHRLRLEDPMRVSLFARRFAPDPCCALDEGARIERVDGGWRAAPGTRRLTEEGEVVQFEAAAAGAAGGPA